MQNNGIQRLHLKAHIQLAICLKGSKNALVAFCSFKFKIYPSWVNVVIFLARYYGDSDDYAICYTSCNGYESQLTYCSLQICSQHNYYYSYYYSYCYNPVSTGCCKEYFSAVKTCYYIFSIFR